MVTDKVQVDYSEAIKALQMVVAASPTAAPRAMDAIRHIRENKELPDQDTFDLIVGEALEDTNLEGEQRELLASLITVVEDYAQ